MLSNPFVRACRRTTNAPAVKASHSLASYLIFVVPTVRAPLSQGDAYTFLTTFASLLLSLSQPAAYINMKITNLFVLLRVGESGTQGGAEPGGGGEDGKMIGRHRIISFLLGTTRALNWRALFFLKPSRTHQALTQVL